MLDLERCRKADAPWIFSSFLMIWKNMFITFSVAKQQLGKIE